MISREDDPAWYEACNPLIPSARGLVPVAFFEVISKTERQSTGPAVSGAIHTLPQHDSGYSEKGAHSRQDSNATAKLRMSSIGKSSGAMVYGVVQYDFNAERPDELEAKAGEPIVVTAQSTPEWFVAKPIGRLGGPGLIPVSFVEIRDMQTGQAVPDAQEAVARAGVPKVEEWKKMTKYYRDNSIPLGKIETGNGRMSLSNAAGQNVNGHVSRILLIWVIGTNKVNDRVHYLFLCRPQYRGTALTTINIGTLSRLFWRTVGTGSCLDFIRISMTFKSHYCRNSRLRRATKVDHGRFRSCQGR